MVKSPYKIFFHTLGNKTRLEIIHALRKKPMNVTELTEALPYKQSTISHNLKLLISCQFVYIEPLLKIIDRHVHKFCEKVCLPE